MNRLLFAYGTLQHPGLIRHILGRTPRAEKALLMDYARYTLRGENFPGIVPEPGRQTDGTLFSDLTEQEWERLDRYEADWYVRLELPVITASRVPLQACVYVIPEQHRHRLSDHSWSLEQYEPGIL